jgi:hypothetical protein
LFQFIYLVFSTKVNLFISSSKMKFIKFIIILIFSFFFLAASLPKLSKALFETDFFPDDYRFGDLYRLSNLAQFKEAPQKCEKIVYSNPENIGLYIIGDSFLEKERASLEDFNAKTYQYVHLNDKATFVLDSTKRNVLVIESVERHFREHLSKQLINYQLDTINSIPNESSNYEVFNSEKFQSLFLSFSFFEKIKEWKAALNLWAFERTNPKVSLSDDKQNILLRLDTDASKINSNYNELADDEVNKMIENLNSTKKYYLDLGFDDVVFSIIPNKTTICCNDTTAYNHLIERVQNHQKLNMNFIDVIALFKDKSVYEKGDTHWNCLGRRLYLDALNRKILDEK